MQRERVRAKARWKQSGRRADYRIRARAFARRHDESRGSAQFFREQFVNIFGLNQRKISREPHHQIKSAFGKQARSPVNRRALGLLRLFDEHIPSKLLGVFDGWPVACSYHDSIRFRSSGGGSADIFKHSPRKQSPFIRRERLSKPRLCIRRVFDWNQQGFHLIEITSDSKVKSFFRISPEGTKDISPVR